MAKFKDVEINPNYPLLEESILKFWKSNNIFDELNKNSNDLPKYVYYDGPITANGIPHYGHALTWTMKDLFPRYYTMKGFFVERNIGWDCQGILVEYEVEKKLGFKHKSDVEKMGVDKFNHECRNSVLSYRSKMVEYETRLGRWIDHSKEYATMDSSYIESMWWGIKTLHEKGLLYEGHKVVAYSTRSGMTLSTHEVADGGYSEVIDPAVIVKFKLDHEPNTFLLAFTTTPWTLPGNLLLAIGKKIEYIKVKYNSEIFIVAKERVAEIFKGKDNYEVLENVSADSLIGKSYVPLFPYYINKKNDGAFEIVYADHVNIEEGTGIVHLAPYGQEDFDILMKLKIPIFDYITETGEFTHDIPEYSGQFYKKANKNIILDLQKSDKLFEHFDYAHQMPIDYRTREPLIYKPITSWYIKVGDIKGRLLSEAKKVHIVPDSGKARFVNWIENARDWSLSRRRFWGTPLPIWINDKTKDIKIVGSFKELEELSGKKLGDNFDPHKPFVDDITWEKDGGTYKRVPEVIDVWFDSGSMPYARYHYPFENIDLFNSAYPAQYISESDDQIRLWFYTMFVLGVALFDKSPFENVIVTGMLGDEDGKKMSKSKGNYPPIEEVFEKYGSDILRYFLLTSPLTKMEPARFSYRILLETQKEFFTTLWNSYRYFVTYANLNDFKPTPGFNGVGGSNILDNWILIKFDELTISMNAGMDKYDVMSATKLLAPFVMDLSTWYIRRSRDRISSGDSSALNILYLMLVGLAKLIAPFMPFLSEEIYLNLSSCDANALKSVHMTDYPVADNTVQSASVNKILGDMEVARKIASIGNAVRKETGIPIRQPLSLLRIVGTKKLQDDITNLLLDELNVKKIEFTDVYITSDDYAADWKGRKDDVPSTLGVYFNVKLSEDLKLEGTVREIIREIQKLRKEAGVKWDDLIEVTYPNKENYERAVKKHIDDIKSKTLSKTLEIGEKFEIKGP